MYGHPFGSKSPDYFWDEVDKWYTNHLTVRSYRKYPAEGLAEK